MLTLSSLLMHAKVTYSITLPLGGGVDKTGFGGVADKHGMCIDRLRRLNRPTATLKVVCQRASNSASS